jgi:hypothetical protein
MSVLMTKRTNSERCYVLAAMKRAGAPHNREEFLNWFYLGDVPEVIPPDDECEFPEEFQRETLDEPSLTDKVQ